MEEDVCDAKALIRVELQHAGDEVLEVLREEALLLAVRVRVVHLPDPEEVGSVCSKALVLFVIPDGHFEGLFARVQVKEDYTEGEQVDNLTLVWLLIEDFRSHVGWGSG